MKKLHQLPRFPSTWVWLIKANWLEQDFWNIIGWKVAGCSKIRNWHSANTQLSLSLNKSEGLVSLHNMSTGSKLFNWNNRAYCNFLNSYISIFFDSMGVSFSTTSSCPSRDHSVQRAPCVQTPRSAKNTAGLISSVVNSCPHVYIYLLLCVVVASCLVLFNSSIASIVWSLWASHALHCIISLG